MQLFALGPFLLAPALGPREAVEVPGPLVQPFLPLCFGLAVVSMLPCLSPFYCALFWICLPFGPITSFSVKSNDTNLTRRIDPRHPQPPYSPMSSKRPFSLFHFLGFGGGVGVSKEGWSRLLGRAPGHSPVRKSQNNSFHVFLLFIKFGFWVFWPSN